MVVRVMHAGGGVTLNVWNLLRNIASYTDWQVTLLSAPMTGVPPVDLKPIEEVKVHMLETRQVPILGKLFDCWPVGFCGAFEDILPTVDLVHFHSLWRYPTRQGCRILRDRCIPYIIAPCGTLNPWAIRYRRLRKQVAMITHERKNISMANCLHATSLAEVVEFRKLGFTGPVAILPAGINEGALDAFQVRNNPEPASENRKRKLLFVARLHPIKRVKELVHVWCRIAGQFENWGLEIVGSGDAHYEADIRKSLLGTPVAQRTILRGHLMGANLWEAYRSADLFVLPSHSENFGNVVIEALAAGLPVITTQGTPWSDLEKRKCGWCIGMSIDELESTLQAAMRLSDAKRRAMGRRGRSWVLNEFTWPQIARKTVEVYEWITEGCIETEAPECIQFQ